MSFSGCTNINFICIDIISAKSGEESPIPQNSR